MHFIFAHLTIILFVTHCTTFDFYDLVPTPRNHLQRVMLPLLCFASCDAFYSIWPTNMFFHRRIFFLLLFQVVVKACICFNKTSKMISPNIWVMGIFLLSMSLIQSRSDQLSYRLHRTGTVGPINRPFPFSHAFIYRMVLLQRSHLWRSILLTEVVWLRSAWQQEAQPFFQHRMWFLDMRV